jgi:hypothetical protein
LKLGIFLVLVRSNPLRLFSLIPHAHNASIDDVTTMGIISVDHAKVNLFAEGILRILDICDVT